MACVDWDDMPRWGLINKALGLSVPEPVETYSSSPHLSEGLDLPHGPHARLPHTKPVLAGVAPAAPGAQGTAASAHPRRNRGPLARRRRRPTRAGHGGQSVQGWSGPLWNLVQCRPLATVGPGEGGVAVIGRLFDVGRVSLRRAGAAVTR